MEKDERTKAILERWSPLLRKLSGLDDVVTGVCPECQFEQGRAGGDHSPVCSHNKGK